MVLSRFQVKQLLLERQVDHQGHQMGQQERLVDEVEVEVVDVGSPQKE